MEKTFSWQQKIIGWLIAHRTVILFSALVLLVAGWPVSEHLQFDRSIESLYGPNDPHLQAFLRSKQIFGGDEYVIVAYTVPNLFSQEEFERLRRFAQQLSQVPGVDPHGVQNLADALSPPQLPPAARRILVRLHQDDLKNLFRGILLGTDNQTTGIVLRLLDKQHCPVPREQTIQAIRKLAAQHQPPAVVVGEPVQINDMFRYVEQDASLLFWVSLAALGTVILILFKSVRWVALPVLVVVAAVVWTRASLALSHLKLSMISSVLNALMTIIGVATVMHVAVRFRQHRQTLLPSNALQQTLSELASPIFWACATTAAGFLALLSSSITPVRSFSLMMGLGTMLVFVGVFLILPGGVLLGRPAEATPVSKPVTAETAVHQLLSTSARWAHESPKKLATAVIGVTVLAACGLARLQVETDFSKNFRKSSDIVRSLDFVEQKLGGAGTWEIDFPAPPQLDEAYLNRLRRAAQALRRYKAQQCPDLTKVLCLTDALDLIPTLPLFSHTLEKKLRLLSQLQPGLIKGFYNPKAGRMRILLRSYERRSAEIKQKIVAGALAAVRTEFPQASATGMYVLLTHLIESLLRDQLVSFIIALVSIALMMTLAFQSVPLALISLVPNLFPIIFVIGVMGWIGLRVNIATAMIASVSMGLTIDSSIHYLTAYQRAKRQGLSPKQALLQTQSGVGKALVFANAALIVGFSVLTLSHFIPLIHFGILVSVAMLGGLAGNLLVLPLLLAWYDRATVPESTPE